jgi:hypothetical protein
MSNSGPRAWLTGSATKSLGPHPAGRSGVRWQAEPDTAFDRAASGVPRGPGQPKAPWPLRLAGALPKTSSPTALAGLDDRKGCGSTCLIPPSPRLGGSTLNERDAKPLLPRPRSVSKPKARRQAVSYRPEPEHARTGPPLQFHIFSIYSSQQMQERVAGAKLAGWKELDLSGVGATPSDLSVLVTEPGVQQLRSLSLSGNRLSALPREIAQHGPPGGVTR